MKLINSAIPDVTKSVVVDADPTTTFAVFTERTSTWWPPTHKVLDGERLGVAIQPWRGGRYFEWGAAGEEADWGVVDDIEAPFLIHLSWRIGKGFAHLDADAPCSRIEVNFEPVGAGTRVTLVHADFDQLGYEEGQWLRNALDGPSPGETLQLFATAVAKLAPQMVRR